MVYPQSQYHSGFAGLSEDGTGLPDTSPRLMFGGVHQNQQLHWMKDQVEYRGSDLFRTAHTDLDGDVLVDGPVDFTSTGVLAKREDDIAGVEPVTEGLTEDIFGIVVVLPHGPEATPANVFPLST